jgi:hypothetical protein
MAACADGYTMPSRLTEATTGTAARSSGLPARSTSTSRSTRDGSSCAQVMATAAPLDWPMIVAGNASSARDRRPARWQTGSGSAGRTGVRSRAAASGRPRPRPRCRQNARPASADPDLPASGPWGRRGPRPSPAGRSHDLRGSECRQLFARQPGQTHVVHGPGALGGEVLTGHDGRDVDHRVHGGGRH